MGDRDRPRATTGQRAGLRREFAELLGGSNDLDRDYDSTIELAVTASQQTRAG